MNVSALSPTLENVVDLLNGSSIILRSNYARWRLVNGWHGDRNFLEEINNLINGLEISTLTSAAAAASRFKLMEAYGFSRDNLAKIAYSWTIIAFKDQDEYSTYCGELVEKAALSHHKEDVTFSGRVITPEDIKRITTVLLDCPLITFLLTIQLTGPLTPEEQATITAIQNGSVIKVTTRKEGDNNGNER